MSKKKIKRPRAKLQTALQLDASGDHPSLIQLTIRKRQSSSKPLIEIDVETVLSPKEYKFLIPLVPHKPLYAKLVLGIEKNASGGHCPECEA